MPPSARIKWWEKTKHANERNNSIDIWRTIAASAELEMHGIPTLIHHVMTNNYMTNAAFRALFMIGLLSLLCSKARRESPVLVLLAPPWRIQLNGQTKSGRKWSVMSILNFDVIVVNCCKIPKKCHTPRVYMGWGSGSPLLFNIPPANLAWHSPIVTN